MDKNINTSFMSDTDLNNYPIKIKRDNLIEYLVSRLNLKESEVNKCLYAFTCMLDGNIDVWKKPLLLQKDVFYLALLPIKAPIMVRIIDGWLDFLNFNLGERGKLFEDYVKNRIKQIFTLKKRELYIYPKSKVYSSSNFEEIDLILVLKNVVIIAEIKCQPYAVNPREHFNAHNTIKKGVKQVKRKTEFLLSEKLEDKDLQARIEGKEIISLVITNFPTFSGYSIDGIPIADFYLLDAYFSSGSVSDGYIKFKYGFTKRVINKRSYYYNSENTMNSRLKSFLNDPPPVRNLENHFELKTSKFTPEGAGVDIFCEHFVPITHMQTNE